MVRFLVDICGAHGSGKTSVITFLKEYFDKANPKLMVYHQKSYSRSYYLDKDVNIYNDVSDAGQALISLSNLSDIFGGFSKGYRVVLTTDFLVRGIAYSSGATHCKFIETHLERLLSYYLKFPPNKTVCLFFYVPIEFGLIPDGVRVEDENYQQLIDARIVDIYESHGILYHTLSGTVVKRVEQVLKVLEPKIQLYNSTPGG